MFGCSVRALGPRKRTGSDNPKKNSIKVDSPLCQENDFKMATEYSNITLWRAGSVVQSSMRETEVKRASVHILIIHLRLIKSRRRG